MATEPARLAEYRSRRDFRRTPEPTGGGRRQNGRPRFVVKRVGSIRPAATVLSRVGVEKVSTRPVVMVTSLIHSDSRCRVTGLPCTPTLATRPPGRISSVHCSKVCDPHGFDGKVGAEAVGQPSISARPARGWWPGWRRTCRPSHAGSAWVDRHDRGWRVQPRPPESSRARPDRRPRPPRRRTNCRCSTTSLTQSVATRSRLCGNDTRW